ncbi:MAG: hypothetical protein GY785_25860, partial [Gammaproteobacteria bacterium]|nr:hypothetical protein [Gammaproteobacteria bacterium]
GTDSASDGFSTVSYSNNDGTTNWTSSWIEDDGEGGGAGSGYFNVNGGSLQLELAAGDGGDNIYREVDLTGATSATLNFDFNNTLSGEDEIRVRISGNGGSSYSTEFTFSGIANTGAGTANIDISSYIAADTRIQFYVFKNDAGQTMSIDNVSVTYDNGDPTPGGETAFSAANASSDITVTPVNDTPTLAASAANDTLTENTDVTSGVLFTTVTIDPIEPGDDIASAQLTIGGGIENTDTLTINGTAVTNLTTTSATGAVLAGGGTYDYDHTTGVLTINFAGSTSAAAAETILEAITFGIDASDNDPSTTARTVTLNTVTDNGGGADTNVDISETATISVAAVNDTPTLAATPADDAL